MNTVSTAPQPVAPAPGSPSENAPPTNDTHCVLVEAAAKWLQHQGCAVVITEMNHGGRETADAIGWKNGHSILVECKATLADFRADKSKAFRRCPDQGMGYQRFFCTPRGMLSLKKLPPGWGVLEWNGVKMRKRVPSNYQSEVNTQQEVSLLLSALRRVARDVPSNVSVRVYTYESRNRATLGLVGADANREVADA